MKELVVTDYLCIPIIDGAIHERILHPSLSVKELVVTDYLCIPIIDGAIHERVVTH